MHQKDFIYPELSHFINSLDITVISENRKGILQPLKDEIQHLMNEHQPIELVFVCTHNSRRSILAQVWAQTLSAFYQLPNMESYSGGTEATAVYPMIIEVLQKSGFKIDTSSEMQNPIHTISYSEVLPVVSAFSKLYNDPKNPHKEFIAVMSCANADKNCPIIHGAKSRISITYEDPKIADNTNKQHQIYFERNKQIATELKYVLTSIDTY